MKFSSIPTAKLVLVVGRKRRKVTFHNTQHIGIGSSNQAHQPSGAVHDADDAKYLHNCIEVRRKILLLPAASSGFDGHALFLLLTF